VKVSRRPRVLIIGPTPPPYNGMSVATELVLGAIRNEVSLIHLDTSDRRDLSNLGRIDLVNIALAAWHGVRCWWLMLTRRPEIVYVPIAQDTLAFLRDCLFLVPARVLRKKVIVHLHGGYFHAFYQSASSPMQGLMRYALGKIQRAVVLGTALEGMFDGVLAPNRVRVIPNGIPDYFPDDVHGTDDSRPRTILFLGTLMKEKGVLDVLSALPVIAERVPGVRAVFAGGWLRADERELAEQMVRDLKLEPHVEFIGPVTPPRKHEVLRLADVFIMPTFYKNEGHPYAILEAMSAGLPVVSTHVGCIAETVIDGVTGFVIQPGNQEALVERTVLLLTDDNLRKTMGKASRDRFLKQYTVERFSDQMRELFVGLAT
jgi:glycosyltransferase involved in cell wall biosynthesis